MTTEEPDDVAAGLHDFTGIAGKPVFFLFCNDIFNKLYKDILNNCMGVEYKHFMIPDNPSFIPARDVIGKMDAMLEKWHLKTGNPTVYNLTGGQNSIVSGPLDSLYFEGGLGIKYPGVNGVAVSKIMGESYFRGDVSDEDRYMMDIVFIAGVDYRIHPGGNELDITIKQPPMDNAVPIEPYCEYDECLFAHAEAYPSAVSTTAPVIDISVADKKRVTGNQNFFGFWRTAFIIDCGKDLPLLHDDERYTIPNREFTRDLETALGSKVVEIGEVY